MTDQDARDIFAIQQLKGLYCWASDAVINGEAVRDTLLSLFTEDVWADFGFGPVEGRDAMLGYMLEGAGKSMDQMWHSIHTPRIRIEGDTATGDWTVVVRMIPKGQTEPGQVYGRYYDEFRRDGDGWRISRVQWGQEKIVL